MVGFDLDHRSEQDEIVKTLMQTTANTNYMHESINCDNPQQFTREWFAWANTLLDSLSRSGRSQSKFDQLYSVKGTQR